MTASVTPSPEPSPSASDAARRAALGQYDILDTPAEQGFDDIVLLASQVCETPVALVSLVDGDRQWFKARIGFPACQTPLSQSVCALAVRQAETFVIPDLTLDERTRNNTLVTGEPFIRFYAGALIRSRLGTAVGTLCVIDIEPRPCGLTRMQRTSLEALARQVMAQLELRRLLARQDRKVLDRTRERDRAWRLSRDLLVVLDATGTLSAVNGMWTDLLGWAESELVGRPLAAFTHPEDLEATLAAFGGMLEAPLTRPYEHRLRHKDGTYRSFAWTGAFEGGKVYGNGRPTTLEREQAHALAQSEEQLRQSQKMEAVGQLTGGLAHDFNNLLTGVTGNLELLQTRLSQGRVTELDRYIHAAQGAARRAATLTHRLLAFARRQTLEPRPTDVNRLVAGLQELIERTTGPEIAVAPAAGSDLWITFVDPGQLENALLNLCINARDAMPGGGRLAIATANRSVDDRAALEWDMKPGQYVSLCVSDEGHGMTQEVIARAFEPFFTTKLIGHGTGLGLSMVYGFARQSGGQVRIGSELGRGTTVCLYLPRHLEPAPHEDASEPSAAPRAGQGETVLVVDDEPTVRMLVTEVLEELGYTVIEATEASAGLQVLRSDVRIALLVTDVGLPGGMNGRQLAEAGRTIRPDLKVLFVTGYAEHAVLDDGQLEPGMHVLTKPFGMEALAGKIRELIGNQSGLRKPSC